MVTIRRARSPSTTTTPKQAPLCIHCHLRPHFFPKFASSSASICLRRSCHSALGRPLGKVGSSRRRCSIHCNTAHHHISAPSPGLLTFEMALDAPVVLSGLQAASAVRVCAPVDLEAPDGWTRLLASVAQSLGTAALTQPGLCGWTPAASLAWQPQRSRLAGALITSSSSTGDSLTSLAHSRRRPEPSRDIRHRVAAAEGCVCGRVGGCCHPLF